MAMRGARKEFEWVEGADGYEKEMADSENDQLVVAVWSARWCRKCKYLKAKLEKFSVFFPSLTFSVLDVNAMPGEVIKDVDVTQMPTIQIYRNREMLKEIIGADESDAVVGKLRNYLEEIGIVGE
jgi:thioredoxin 1